MSVARFIANRILRSEDQERQDRLSRPIVLIAILGIMLGMAVMILTVSITRGFQREIRAKVLGVGGHLRITSIAQTDPKETPRMELDPELLAALGSLPQVHHVQSFATKPGIIETDEDIEGVIVRGIGTDHDPAYLVAHLVEGSMLRVEPGERRNEVLISAYLRDRLRIGLGDTITIYLVKGRDEIRPRKYHVVGVYRTGLEQVDHQMVLIDIAHLQRFAQWGLQAEIQVKDSCVPDRLCVEGLAFGGDRDYLMEWTGTDLEGPGPHSLCIERDTTIQLVVQDGSGTVADTAWIHIQRTGSTHPSCPPRDQLQWTVGTSGGSYDHYAGGLEIDLRSYEDLDVADEQIHRHLLDPEQQVTTVKERSPEIFAWLELLDTNVLVVIILMVVVAIINMTSALLIIILERTTMIGVLKALGASNGLVRRIFLIDGAYILGIGIVGGDLLGLALAWLQRITGLVRLPIESYYVDQVPVDLSLWPVLVLNLGTLVVCVAALLLPSLLVTRIAPARAIRFA
ncbi:MAG: ABC transporter permease [Flavobacteriales bacterium]|nr:ABC transporter permease [Flavobacteriales bacterium]